MRNPNQSHKHTIYTFFQFIQLKSHICRLNSNGKRTKINKKRPRLTHFYKTCCFCTYEVKQLNPNLKNWRPVVQWNLSQQWMFSEAAFYISRRVFETDLLLSSENWIFESSSQWKTFHSRGQWWVTATKAGCKIWLKVASSNPLRLIGLLYHSMKGSCHKIWQQNLTESRQFESLSAHCTIVLTIQAT